MWPEEFDMTIKFALYETGREQHIKMKPDRRHSETLVTRIADTSDNEEEFQKFKYTPLHLSRSATITRTATSS